MLNNKLIIGHRPKLKAIEQLKKDGFTHVVTILSEREGAQQILSKVAKHGLTTIWIPLGSAEPVKDKKTLEVIEKALGEISSAIEQGGKIYMHCSAGIHRTGMVAYALLNYMGYSDNEARPILKTLREVTYQQVGEERLKWALQFQRTKK